MDDTVTTQDIRPSTLQEIYTVTPRCRNCRQIVYYSCLATIFGGQQSENCPLRSISRIDFTMLNMLTVFAPTQSAATEWSMYRRALTFDLHLAVSASRYPTIGACAMTGRGTSRQCCVLEHTFRRITRKVWWRSQPVGRLETCYGD